MLSSGIFFFKIQRGEGEVEEAAPMKNDAQEGRGKAGNKEDEDEERKLETEETRLSFFIHPPQLGSRKREAHAIITKILERHDRLKAITAHSIISSDS